MKLGGTQEYNNKVRNGLEWGDVSTDYHTRNSEGDAKNRCIKLLWYHDVGKCSLLFGDFIQLLKLVWGIEIGKTRAINPFSTGTHS